MTTGINKYWLIAQRPFQETSVIAELITTTDQRISAVVKGAKKAKFSGYLNPFSCLSGKILGKTNLKTLTAFEPIKQYNLKGIKLFCGFYINELILRATVNGQLLEGISNIYEHALNKLATSNQITIQPVLREFELNLLDISGYLPNLNQNTITNTHLQDNQTYVAVNELGIVSLQELTKPDDYQEISPPFKGYIWKDLFNRALTKQGDFNAYKTIMRFLLKPLIGDKPLNSHKFFK